MLFFFASNFNVGSKIEMKYAPFYFRNMACNMNSGIFTRAHLFQCAHTCYNVANKQTNEKRMKKKLFSFGHFHLRNCIENNVDVSFPTSDCFCLSGQYFRCIFVYERWNGLREIDDEISPHRPIFQTTRTKNQKERMKIEIRWILFSIDVLNRTSVGAACGMWRLQNWKHH